MTTARPIYVSTGCIVKRAPLLDRVAAYHNVGIDAIELGMYISLVPDDLSRLAEMDRPFLIHNYFPPPDDSFILNLASADPVIKQRSLDLAGRAIVLSRQFQAPFYSIHAGFVTDAYGFGKPYLQFPAITEPNAREKALARFVAACTITNQVALDNQVGLLIENNVCAPEIEGQVLLDTADEFLALFDAVKSPNLGILLDFGHLNVAAHTLGFDRLDFIERLAPYIRAFHVQENDGSLDTHSPVQPGSWVLEVLRRPEFAHLPLVVEAIFEDATRLARHAAWLRRALAE